MFSKEISPPKRSTIKPMELIVEAIESISNHSSGGLSEDPTTLKGNSRNSGLDKAASKSFDKIERHIRIRKDGNDLGTDSVELNTMIEDV